MKTLNESCIGSTGYSSSGSWDKNSCISLVADDLWRFLDEELWDMQKSNAYKKFEPQINKKVMELASILVDFECYYNDDDLIPIDENLCNTIYEYFDDFVQMVKDLYKDAQRKNNFSKIYYFYYDIRTKEIDYTSDINLVKNNQSTYVLFDIIEPSAIKESGYEDDEIDDYIMEICDLDLNEFSEDNGETMRYYLNRE